MNCVIRSRKLEYSPWHDRKKITYLKKNFEGLTPIIMKWQTKTGLIIVIRKRNVVKIKNIIFNIYSFDKKSFSGGTSMQLTTPPPPPTTSLPSQTFLKRAILIFRYFILILYLHFICLLSPNKIRSKKLVFICNESVRKMYYSNPENIYIYLHPLLILRPTILEIEYI